VYSPFTAQLASDVADDADMQKGSRQKHASDWSQDVQQVLGDD
jgi:hypothetical protein